MMLTPVAATLIAFIGILAMLTGAHLIHHGFAHLAKARVRAG